MLESYEKHVAERAALGIVPKPLDAEQTAALVELLKAPPQSPQSMDGNEQLLLELIAGRVPAGVDQAAYIKAAFLAAVVRGEAESPLIDRERAVDLLGMMHGGYNIAPLIECLDDAQVADEAARALSHTLLMFDAFYDVEEKAKAGNAHAKQVLQSWADAEWFTDAPAVAERITLTAFVVPGETNTDDLSPAVDAWSRPDIPLHAQAMLKNPRKGLPSNPLEVLAKLKDNGFPVAFVGDVVGTGSSRKSAANSVLWHTGHDIPGIPNKRAGGYCIGGQIAPIFFNTLEDSGALPVETDVSKIKMGDVIDLFPYQGELRRHVEDGGDGAGGDGAGDGAGAGAGELLGKFELKTDVLLDEVRAGGRINLIIGRGLTARARESLGLPAVAEPALFRQPSPPAKSNKGYTLAQKMVGKACGLPGVRPGQYCEMKMSTVGSQDTTGPMTRDELKDLACLGFQADLVMQSFCHTSAYPKPVDIETQHSLPDFMMDRAGVSLRPGDGIIHSWLNRMLLPDTVGTGGDSHTRFPIGISFPAGSGLVAFAAATGVMPLDMPESVLVRFSGELQPGITLRDLVHALPYAAIQRGLLTVEKKGKKNVFSGRVLEIEGLPNLKVEQAFEFADASAERSASGCTIKLNKEPIIEYITSNIVMLKWMLSENYGDARSINRRIDAMQSWLDNPQLMRADEDAEYFEVIDIDLNKITEPILCAPNDPDDARLLSEVAGDSIDEVFIGSCMTNIGHFRATSRLLDKMGQVIPTRMWIVPPTRMDQAQLMEEGHYAVFARAGARTEPPGCSLCMGNQARVADGASVISTSTRNFPNRLGKDANVYLASSELAAVAGVLGRLPSVKEYLAEAGDLNTMAADIYRYLNFNEIESYNQAADSVRVAAPAA
ncbi:MAG: bifunctional aconitate hydratase 2/2-methylisocitrate dehydratase [Gammaproteobacteria bacterium]|nr:bifunctional aconitate hydratase 2/2-methylisocitrate dehydratase [Gammaproteobacteria bacterium]